MSAHQVLDHVDQYLQLGREYECSDLHLPTAYPPAWRRFGQLSPIWEDHQPLTAQDTERLVRSFLGETEWNRLQEHGDIDFAYSAPNGRYRASVVKQRLGYDMAFRIINDKIKTLEEIGLPLEHILPLTRYQNGLVLVTGSVGSGKSTTLAALVDFINRDREDHILTLEDPIEYVFESKGCHVNQREVHKHTESFARALRGALREDPDVIMVGEMRDLETIQLALTAAETGHLVFATLHTNSAVKTMDRIIDVFPSGQQPQIRAMLSESLRGVVAQTLFTRADKQGRIAAFEILKGTKAVANLIREGKNHQIPSMMQTGAAQGMVLYEKYVEDLVKRGLVSAQDARIFLGKDELSKAA